MQEDKFLMFRNRLEKVYRHLSRQAKKAGVTCYRLYDHDLPEFPFCIECYGDKLYIAEYKRRHGMSDEAHAGWMEKCLVVIRSVIPVEKTNIFLRLRQRKAGRLGQYRKQDEQKAEFVVSENGLQFIVNLSDYLDTGLFLDHRATRQLVKEQCSGKKVLNLFAYTGSFSVYAAAGGAKEVVTLDLSKTYLAWAERNMQLNGFNDKQSYRYIHADVLQYLSRIPKEAYDLIILDPPTFSNSSRMEDFLDIQKDHVKLINQCLHGLSSGGKIFFSTNARTFELDRGRINAKEIKDITKQTTPFDFVGKWVRRCYLILSR
jgi:23S rRNA (cytosine1962-C5)-methyltransferase